MGLKQKFIDAKINAAKDSGVTEPLDTSNGSYIEREAEYAARAILETLSEANLTITQLKAPVILETLKTPDQLVNVELETLLGPYQPVLKILKKIGIAVPGIESLIDKLEGEIEKAIKPLLIGGAKLAGLDLEKDDGALESRGYVYIGEDPDSVEAFDVEEEDGQGQNTTVHLSIEDIEELL